MSFVCYKHNRTSNKSTTTKEIPVCSDIVRDFLLVLELEANIVKKIKKQTPVIKLKLNKKRLLYNWGTN